MNLLNRIVKLLSLFGLFMLLISCSPPNKRLLPLRDIDRPLTDPKGTWVASAGASLYYFRDKIADTEDTRISSLNLSSLIPGYSITDRIAIPNILVPNLAYLVIPPKKDSVHGYKPSFQLAVDGGINSYNFTRIRSVNFNLYAKLPLNNSWWTMYSARVQPMHLSNYWWTSGSASAGLGWQMTNRSSLRTAATISYSNNPEWKGIGGYGSLGYNINFNPYVSWNVAIYNNSSQRWASGGVSTGYVFRW